MSSPMTRCLTPRIAIACLDQQRGMPAFCHLGPLDGEAVICASAEDEARNTRHLAGLPGAKREGKMARCDERPMSDSPAPGLLIC